VDVFWRRAISAETRSHCRPECGIAPFRRGNAHKSSVVLCSFAVSAKCIAIASSEFSGGAVISIDWFGDGGVGGSIPPSGLAGSATELLLILRLGMIVQGAEHPTASRIASRSLEAPCRYSQSCHLRLSSLDRCAVPRRVLGDTIGQSNRTRTIYRLLCIKRCSPDATVFPSDQ
jgi:hypothetical protein